MREFDKKMNRAFRQLRLKPGDIYESCSCHPVLCLGVDYKRDEIWGVSLIDGTHPLSCSLLHCGVRRLTPKQAWEAKMHGPLDVEARDRVAQERRWWNASTEKTTLQVRLSGPRRERATSSAKAPTVKKAGR